MSEEKTLIRKLSIYCVFILGTLSIIGISIISYNRYSEWRLAKIAEQKEIEHRIAQEQIRDMIKFCNFAKLDADEQASIDKCGDDVMAAKDAISLIIDDRVNFWGNKYESLIADTKELVRIKNDATYWDASLERLFQNKVATLKERNNTIYSNVTGWQKVQKEFKDYNPLKKQEKFL